MSKLEGAPGSLLREGCCDTSLLVNRIPASEEKTSFFSRHLVVSVGLGGENLTMVRFWLFTAQIRSDVEGREL